MNDIVFTPSVSHAGQFVSPSHKDSRPFSTILVGIWRAFAVVFFSLCALAHNVITIPFLTSTKRLHARTVWLHRWCRFACRVLGIRVATNGSMPRVGLLVC